MPGVPATSQQQYDSQAQLSPGGSGSGSASLKRGLSVERTAFAPSYTYLPPSPPKSRSPSPFREGTSSSVPRQRTNTAAYMMQQQSSSGGSSTTSSIVANHHAGAAAAVGNHDGLSNGSPIASTSAGATQRKGSLQRPENQPYQPHYATGALSSGYSSGPHINLNTNGSANGHAYPASSSPYPAGSGKEYVNGHVQSPVGMDGSLSEGTTSKILHKAADIVKAASGSNGRALPTHNGAPARPSGMASHAHSRRKSIAQAIAPSISTVRFVSYCALWYTSSALSSNTGKSLLNRFKYPVTLTFIQFGFVAGWCIIFCVGRTKLAQLGLRRDSAGHSHSRSMSVAQLHSATWGIKKPTRKQLESVMMMSVFQVAGHIFSSMAIARVPVSTVHTIKALSPLFTVLSYGLLFGVRYSSATWISLLPLTLGVMLACSFDLRANAAGLVCALGSTLVFVSQNIFSKKLLPKDGAVSSSEAGGVSEKRLDKLHLLLYSSGMAFLAMIPLWAYYDGTRFLLSSEPTIRTASWGTLASLYALNGTVHFLQNLLAFAILSLTSPVTYSIASLVKRIAVICMAIVWFRQPIFFVQGVGISMTFAGLYMYNQAKGDVARGENARVRVERRNTMNGLLPTTKEDVGLESAGAKGWGLVR